MIKSWNKTYTVQKSGGPIGYDAAGFIEDAQEPPKITIRATIMRFSEKDMINTPEGKSPSDFIKIYTSTELNIASTYDQTNGDIITYKGRDYEIVRRENWEDFTNAGLNHFRYAAQLKKPKS